MVICDQAQSLDITGPIEVFNIANLYAAQENPDLPEPYLIETVAEKAGPVTTSSGIRIHADNSFLGYDSSIETLLIAGGRGVFEAREKGRLMRFLSDAVSVARRTASICNGSFLLAETGALDGKKATTHWADAERMQKEYPKTVVNAEAILIKEGHL